MKNNKVETNPIFDIEYSKLLSPIVTNDDGKNILKFDINYSNPCDTLNLFLKTENKNEQELFQLGKEIIKDNFTLKNKNIFSTDLPLKKINKIVFPSGEQILDTFFDQINSGSLSNTDKNKIQDIILHSNFIESFNEKIGNKQNIEMKIGVYTHTETDTDHTYEVTTKTKLPFLEYKSTPFEQRQKLSVSEIFKEVQGNLEIKEKYASFNKIGIVSTDYPTDYFYPLLDKIQDKLFDTAKENNLFDTISKFRIPDDGYLPYPSYEPSYDNSKINVLEDKISNMCKNNKELSIANEMLKDKDFKDENKAKFAELQHLFNTPEEKETFKQYCDLKKEYISLTKERDNFQDKIKPFTEKFKYVLEYCKKIADVCSSDFIKLNFSFELGSKASFSKMEYDKQLLDYFKDHKNIENFKPIFNKYLEINSEIKEGMEKSPLATKSFYQALDSFLSEKQLSHISDIKENFEKYIDYVKDDIEREEYYENAENFKDAT